MLKQRGRRGEGSEDRRGAAWSGLYAIWCVIKKRGKREGSIICRPEPSHRLVLRADSNYLHRNANKKHGVRGAETLDRGRKGEEIGKKKLL